LNGRVYDPLVGRMMSADPFVPDPLNAQAWNRYSYVINNPLAFTDPNGYCFLGMCSWGKAISTFFGRTFGVLFREYPILGTLFEIAAVALCGPGAPACAVSAAFASTTFVAGVTSGNLGYALRAGLIAAVTATAFYEVGEITGHNPAFGTDKYFANVAGHALVGCASAAASGGKCGPAALAGGVGSAAAPFINGPNFAANVVSNAVLGGLASVAGGGKFANGAVTAAFGYLFNSAAGRAAGHVIGGIIGAILGGGPEDVPAEVLGSLIGGEIGDRLTGPEKTETFYRTMSQANYEQFLGTGQIPATGETFISPSLEYASQYDGVTVQFNVQAGTTDTLLGMGVKNAGLSGGAYDNLPLVESGWGSSSAFFKLEGNAVNIGLGYGSALNTFNANIVNWSRVPKP
jgi:uncharacterized protein YcfJ